MSDTNSESHKRLNETDVEIRKEHRPDCAPGEQAPAVLRALGSPGEQPEATTGHVHLNQSSQPVLPTQAEAALEAMNYLASSRADEHELWVALELAEVVACAVDEEPGDVHAAARWADQQLEERFGHGGLGDMAGELVCHLHPRRGAGADFVGSNHEAGELAPASEGR